MTISLNTLRGSITNFAQETLPALSPSMKKIALFVTTVFATIAALYAIYKYTGGWPSLGFSSSVDSTEETDPIVNEPKTIVPVTLRNGAKSGIMCSPRNKTPIDPQNIDSVDDKQTDTIDDEDELPHPVCIIKCNPRNETQNDPQNSDIVNNKLTDTLDDDQKTVLTHISPTKPTKNDPVDVQSNQTFTEK